MKTSFLVPVGFTFLLATSARGQDPTVFTPTERSERAAAALAPSDRPQTSPAPTPKPKPTPVAPGPKAAVAATPAAAKESGAEAAIRDAETRWLNSVAKHDASVAEELLADDYAGVSALGAVTNKRSLLAQIKRETDVYDFARIGKLEVRVFGTAAVAIGTSKEKGKDQQGRTFERNYRWTDTWVIRNARWQCVASQSVAVQR